MAARGGEELAAFVTGLDAARDVPPDQSVLGHSYGSVVLSFALRRPTGIDRVALFGSPGTGGAVRSIVDTGLAPGGFNVLGSVDDPVVGERGPRPRARRSRGRRAPDRCPPMPRATRHRPPAAPLEVTPTTSRSAATAPLNLAAVVADRHDATVPESESERRRKRGR